MAWNEPGGGDNKDPWGRRKNEAPDLDEALRQLSKRFSKVFGGGNRGGDGDGDNGSTGAGIGLGFLALIVFVIWVVSGIYIVGPAEESVVLRFGRYSETVTPGPHWIPRFIESQYTLNVQKLYNFTYTALMLNKDENIVSVSVAVQYRIDNPRDFLFNVVNPSASLKQATASALRQVVGQTSLDEILTTGREKVSREVSAQLRKIMAIYNAGIEVNDVALQMAKAPEEVKAAFDDAIKAQEDEQRYRNQAEAYKRGVEPIAKGKANRILQEADAYKQQVIFQAKGDVQEFLQLLPEYKQAPSVTRKRLYISTMEDILSNVSKVLVDVKGGNSMFYLPLDKILNQQGKKAVSAKSHPNIGISKDFQQASRRTPNLQSSNNLLTGRAARGRGIFEE